MVVDDGADRALELWFDSDPPPQPPLLWQYEPSRQTKFLFGHQGTPLPQEVNTPGYIRDNQKPKVSTCVFFFFLDPNSNQFFGLTRPNFEASSAFFFA